MEEFFGPQFRRLVARLERTYRSGVSAEDAVQEALMRAWQLTTAGRDIHSWDGWPATAAANIARSEWRRRQAEARALQRYARLTPLATDWTGGLPDPGPAAEALRVLPPRQRQVVVMHYLGGLGVREIAARLGIREGTVKSSLHHARDTLRRALSAHERPEAVRRMGMRGWCMAGTFPDQYGKDVVADAYNGQRAAKMWCNTAQPDGFGTLMQMFQAASYRGKRMRLAAAVRTKDVEWAGLWMRVDGAENEVLAFDNMSDRPIRGTTDWSHYAVVLDVAAQATAVAFGLLVEGRGEAWLADVRFEEVGLDVPTTGSGPRGLPDGPQNLDFSEV